mgnify:CR=1 FL=1
MYLLKDDVHKILDMAVENFNADGALSPVLLGVFEGEKKIIALDFDLGKHKQAFVEKLLSLIHQGKLTEYIFIFEAWMVKQDSKTEINKVLRNYETLQSHPERTEVLMVQYCNPVEEIHFISEVERGIKPVLGEWQRLDLSNCNSQNEGRMQSLFKKGRIGWN